MEIISKMSAPIQIAWIHKAVCCCIASVSVSVLVCVWVRTLYCYAQKICCLFVTKAQSVSESRRQWKRERERRRQRERQQKTAPQWSHEQAAWKLNGVPFPCRDCHFRFLYLYKSQSKPNTCEARRATLRTLRPPLSLPPTHSLAFFCCLGVHEFFMASRKVKNTEKRP